MQATLAKLPTELVNAFSTFRNSPAPFSIQCGRKQNGTQNEKQEQNEANKTRTETEHREQWERRSRWKRLNYILGIVALSVFQFVIVCLRRHRKILNGNFAIWFIEGVRERSQQRGKREWKGGRQLCLHCKFLPNFERKWIRLWRAYCILVIRCYDNRRVQLWFASGRYL